MNAEIKARWVAALRSGDYQQGKAQLAYRIAGEDKPRFCCLGVLCELAVEAGIVRRERAHLDSAGQSFDYTNTADKSRTSFLPSEVIGKWAGLRKANPDVLIETNGNRVWHPLAILNDKLDKTFAEIADAIENSPM